MTDRKKASREEDFRDYDQRHIGDGWPYPDSDDTRRVGQNAPYGTSGANPDQADQGGLEVTSDPVAQSAEGVPVPFSEGTDDVIADDDLEARILEALEEDRRIDLSMLDLTVRDGVAELDGAVDSQEDRLYLISLLRRIKGVHDVRADGLLARGVDSHIPRDVAE